MVYLQSVGIGRCNFHIDTNDLIFRCLSDLFPAKLFMAHIYYDILLLKLNINLAGVEEWILTMLQIRAMNCDLSTTTY